MPNRDESKDQYLYETNRIGVLAKQPCSDGVHFIELMLMESDRPIEDTSPDCRFYLEVGQVWYDDDGEFGDSNDIWPFSLEDYKKAFDAFYKRVAAGC